MADTAELRVLVSLRDQASAQMRTVGMNVDRMGDTFKKVGIAAAAAGAALTAAIVVSVKKLMDYGDAISDMSTRTGIAIQTLQEFGYAIRLSGGSMAELETGIRQMQRALVQASEGTGKESAELARLDAFVAKYETTAHELPELYAETWAQAEKLRGKTAEQSDAFSTLGLRIEALRAMKPENQFLTVAVALAAVQDPTLRASLAMDLFGRAGTQLLPMLEGGATGMEEMRKRAHALGLVLSDEDVKAADAAKKEFAELRMQVETLAMSVVKDLLPLLRQLWADVQPLVIEFAKWAKENPAIVKDMVQLVAVMGAAVAVTGPFGPLVQAMAGAIAALSFAVVKLKDDLLALLTVFAGPFAGPLLAWQMAGKREEHGPPSKHRESASDPWAGYAPPGYNDRPPSSAGGSASAPQTIILQVDGREMARVTSGYLAQGAMQRRRMGG